MHFLINIQEYFNRRTFIASQTCVLKEINKLLNVFTYEHSNKESDNRS